MNSELKRYMTVADSQSLGGLPTYHRHCIDRTGKARPGKTAKDRANGVIPRRNRRLWDRDSSEWVRV